MINMQLKRHNKGFTLIELMVVVFILAILATVVIKSDIFSRVDDARESTAKQHIRTIESALQLYRLDNLKYPSTDQGLDALKSGGNGNKKNRTYLARIPKDPWGNPYHYLSPGTKGDIDIFSYGVDGVQSEDDIGNWKLGE